MRPDQTRRLLVFVVCALGVVALYVVPGLTSPPQQRAERGTPSSPTPPMAAEEATLAPKTAPTSPVSRPTVHIQETSEKDQASASEAEQESDPSLRPRQPPQSRTSRPATDAERTPDREQPAPVTSVRVDRVTSETVTVRWRPAHDNEADVSYQVWLNGFEVAATDELSATVDWFNDDMGQHVVQVRALDAAGNESASQSVLVTRPTPTPTAAPPTGSPSAVSTPSDTGSADPPEPTTDSTPQPSTGSSLKSQPQSQPSESDRSGEEEHQ